MKPREFREGDLVLRQVQRTAGMHKLSSPWEGPFIVSKALKNGAYYLVDAQEPDQYGVDRAGEESKRPWNVALLRPFFTYGCTVCISMFINEMPAPRISNSGTALITILSFFVCS